MATDSGYFGGPSWADYDNDGDLDLLITSYDSAPEENLYRNNGDETFSKVSIIPGGDDGTWVATWGDYDNDGDLDLFVGNSSHVNDLYRNNSNGTFTRIAPPAEDLLLGRTMSVSWADWDKDGDLDLYVANNNGNDLFYQNDPTGTLSFLRLGNATVSYGSSWGDFDNDMDPDLFVPVGSNDNYFYRNNGSGNFVLITEGDVITDPAILGD